MRLKAVQEALAAGPPARIVGDPGWKYAATAAIFREGPGGAELLFIRRSAFNGDPWAGQIAFPGGRLEPTDVDLEHTARRETREEVGLDLQAPGVRALGALDELRARARTPIAPMAIRPYAFVLADGSADLTPNFEVASAFWAPLAHLVDPDRRVRFDATRAGAPRTFDAVDLGPGVPLWGLTYQMVHDILARLRI